jgi:hypothetical protein
MAFHLSPFHIWTSRITEYSFESLKFLDYCEIGSEGLQILDTGASKLERYKDLGCPTTNRCYNITQTLT